MVRGGENKMNITIEELADGRWTKSGDRLGSTWGELQIIQLARDIMTEVKV